MKKLYNSEVRAEIMKSVRCAKDVIKESDLTGLPEPVQKYFRYGGYLGKETMQNGEIQWSDVKLKRSPDKDWLSLACYQFNSVPEPCRIVYMKSRLFRIIPFEGRDKYQDGSGNMLIKLLKVIKVGDEKGREMDESALVTVLAETLLIPAYALQDYLRWTAVDTYTAKAMLEYNGVQVRGTFHFNDAGQFTKFESDDRNYTTGKGYRKIKWSAYAENYQESSGIKFPGVLRAVWHLDDGDYEYFQGHIKDIRFNIN
ncbi:MAG: DUF6544 family protein [Peptococcaceae bacterium]